MDQPQQDRTLKCRDCGRDFIWTAKEQAFFAAKGFKNKPARCKECRQKNRQKVEREYFRVECSLCNQTGDVLYKPKDPGASVFCRECFRTKVRSVLSLPIQGSTTPVTDK